MTEDEKRTVADALMGFFVACVLMLLLVALGVVYVLPGDSCDRLKAINAPQDILSAVCR